MPDITTVVFRVVCAWCSAVKTEGSEGAPVSHTICDECSAKLER